MKISELLEEKVEMCPDACCGKPVTECKCGPDCEHCDCYNKNKMNEDNDLLDPLKGAYAELFGKQPKKEDPEKIALDQAMEKYKDDPAGLKAWIMKNRNIVLWLNTNDSEMLGIVKQRIGETTSAGSVAAVAAPIGGMQSRQPKNPDGTAKNALDSDTLMAGKKKKTNRKNRKRNN